ncbi:MAG: CoA transferase [Candidatus Lokiarchaeota archaeon]|nr:CoA transferase [Candidatus Lokiarchaeota archaeon]
MSEIELQLRNLLIEIFDTHMLNRLPADYGGQKFFSDPIFGISKGDDLIFYKFKEVVGTNHLTPLEIFNATGLTECAKNIRVISFIFPYSNIIREASKHVNKIPADEYCIGRNLDLGSKFLPIYNQYHAKDGKFVLTTLTEKQWHRLVSIVLKKTELAIDPRFDNPIKIFDQFDFLDELIEEWALGLTGNQAIKQLEEERIPWGKTYTMYETPSHPNLKARGMTRDDLDFS